jgi:hypothetical protein
MSVHRHQCLGSVSRIQGFYGVGCSFSAGPFAQRRQFCRTGTSVRGGNGLSLCPVSWHVVIVLFWLWCAVSASVALGPHEGTYSQPVIASRVGRYDPFTVIQRYQDLSLDCFYIH